MKHSQMGRFSIDSLFMAQNLETVAFIMRGLVVKSVNLEIYRDSVEYMAIGPDFDAVEPGAKIPMYDAQVTADKEGNAVSVEWIKRA